MASLITSSVAHYIAVLGHAMNALPLTNPLSMFSSGWAALVEYVN